MINSARDRDQYKNEANIMPEIEVNSPKVTVLSKRRLIRHGIIEANDFVKIPMKHNSSNPNSHRRHVRRECRKNCAARKCNPKTRAEPKF